MSVHLRNGFVAACLVALAGGCSICQSGDDHAYAAYGGRWQRTDRHHGRVGSIFSPAGAKVDDAPQAEPEPELIEPEPAPELVEPEPALAPDDAE